MANDSKPNSAEKELDQIIADISREDARQGVPASTSSPRLARAASQSMTLEVQGNLHLKLVFQQGDKSIELRLDENILVCKMADGTEFRIPFDKRGRQAA